MLSLFPGATYEIAYAGEDMIERLDSLPQRDLVDRFERALNEHEPELLLLPAVPDYDQDHRAVHAAGLAAARPIAPVFGKWLVPHVLTYEMAKIQYTGEALPRFASFVDITDVMETKLESIRRYATMLRPVPHIRSLEGVEALATVRGAEIGVRHAEAFGVVRTVSRLALAPLQALDRLRADDAARQQQPGLEVARPRPARCAPRASSSPAVRENDRSGSVRWRTPASRSCARPRWASASRASASAWRACSSFTAWTRLQRLEPLDVRVVARSRTRRRSGSPRAGGSGTANAGRRRRRGARPCAASMRSRRAGSRCCRKPSGGTAERRSSAVELQTRQP